MANFYCEYCGTKSATVAGLVSGNCMKHADGPNKGKHKLYEGSEKSQYTITETPFFRFKLEMA